MRLKHSAAALQHVLSENNGLPKTILNVFAVSNGQELVPSDVLARFLRDGILYV
jgi:hypothetical protein